MIKTVTVTKVLNLNYTVKLRTFKNLYSIFYIFYIYYISTFTGKCRNKAQTYIVKNTDWTLNLISLVFSIVCT